MKRFKKLKPIGEFAGSSRREDFYEMQICIKSCNTKEHLFERIVKWPRLNDCSRMGVNSERN